VLVFRHAGLDDGRHVAFSRKFGELDDAKPYFTLGRKNRFEYDELFDVSNLEDDGSITQPGSKRDALSRGNSVFHVDSAFNPRRAGYSLLRAHKLPPKGTGGGTDFADTRTAWDKLPEDWKKELLEKNYILDHSIWHSRKKAAPDSPYTKDINPMDYGFGRHRLVQIHEPSGRTNLYIAAHAMLVEKPTSDPPKIGPPDETLPYEEGQKIINDIWQWSQRPEFVMTVEWENEGDLIIWDNTCVMHRAGSGTFHGKYIRDMRRATVHDGSSQAWGFNEHSDKRMGLP
jgi:alpha-ketoglutarate-dependent 2,4-dichlorophenoxyacetate dioxygenase